MKIQKGAGAPTPKACLNLPYRYLFAIVSCSADLALLLVLGGLLWTV